MTRPTKPHGAQLKEIRAWGIRRREVDINQLALAYYLLARMRIAEQRGAAKPATSTDGSASAEAA